MSVTVPKLGVSYSVFDGLELLEHSIVQIRESADYVDVSYQNVSWFGQACAEGGLDTLKRLKRDGLIDGLHLYEPQRILDYQRDGKASVMKAKEEETRKRQAGLRRCLDQECTHFLGLDVDEFFVAEEFRRCKEIVFGGPWVYSACSHVNYVRLPTLQRKGERMMKIPFICAINRKSQIGQGPFLVEVDPTRSFDSSRSRWRLFLPEEILMHHMDMVRADLETKYEATSMYSFDRGRLDELIFAVKDVRGGTVFDGKGVLGIPGAVDQPCGVIEVENRFGIPLSLFEDAG